MIKRLGTSFFICIDLYNETYNPIESLFVNNKKLSLINLCSDLRFSQYISKQIKAFIKSF